MELTEEQIEQRREAGRKGGKSKNPNKGFGSMPKAKLQAISRKAGKLSAKKQAAKNKV
jgi:general stress protein YciG